ncbi:hypothetical protein [Maridesulfovibrio sp.]|uniref:hypothetical protein n=1 Tax=Maridesulfovibrio sp. TaxID=2795000 RepID=UPI0029CA269E|nr:hypothetical protein [Maridesulfovibrio sp.]
MENLLYIIIFATLIVGVIFYFRNRRDPARVKAVCEVPSFSRRKKRAPFEESISVAISTDLKDELVRASGNQQSKYVRASLRLALPTLKARPSLVDILDEE